MISKEQMANWDELNNVTLSFLKMIPSQNYHQKPFPSRFRSFAWEFACLYTTREMYLVGLKEEKIDETITTTSEKEAELWDKKTMKKKLEEINLQLKKILNEKECIVFWGKKTPTSLVLSWLCQHEQLHFGKLILYCANKEIAQPTSLMKMWGKESFQKKL